MLLLKLSTCPHHTQTNQTPPNQTKPPSHHITSHHITSHRITSHDITYKDKMNLLYYGHASLCRSFARSPRDQFFLMVNVLSRTENNDRSALPHAHYVFDVGHLIVCVTNPSLFLSVHFPRPVEVAICATHFTDFGKGGLLAHLHKTRRNCACAELTHYWNGLE